MNEHNQVIEEREETCSIVSKLVKLKIFRNQVAGSSMYLGEIIGFECGSFTTSCLSKCHYRRMLDDF